MKPVDITPLIKKYGPGYVAKTERGRVIAHAKRIDVLFNKVKHKKDVVISWVPEPGTRYVFRVSIRVRNNSRNR